MDFQKTTLWLIKDQGYAQAGTNIIAQSELVALLMNG